MPKVINPVRSRSRVQIQVFLHQSPCPKLLPRLPPWEAWRGGHMAMPTEGHTFPRHHQPLRGQSPSWGCSGPLQCPRFGPRQEKYVGLSPGSVTHQLYHLRQAAISEPLTGEGRAKGGTSFYLIFSDSCWETEKPFRSEPAWAQPGYRHQ